MTATAIRQQLHHYLELADDKKVRAIYTLCQNDIAGTEGGYSDEFKAELDRRTAAIKDGSMKLISAKESKKRIEKLLKSR